MLFRAQKGVFPLRADVKHLLDELIGLHRNKLELVTTLHRHSVALSSYTISGDMSASDDLLSEDVFLTAKADLIDFKIATLKSKLCILTGMEPEQLEAYLVKNCTEGKQLKAVRKEIQSVLSDAYMERMRLHTVMDKEISDIKKNIAELSAMQKVRKYAPDCSPLL